MPEVLLPGEVERFVLLLRAQFPEEFELRVTRKIHKISVSFIRGCQHTVRTWGVLDHFDAHKFAREVSVDVLAKFESGDVSRL